LVEDAGAGELLDLNYERVRARKLIAPNRCAKKIELRFGSAFSNELAVALLSFQRRRRKRACSTFEDIDSAGAPTGDALHHQTIW
jgi:hypothetical protein